MSFERGRMRMRRHGDGLPFAGRRTHSMALAAVLALVCHSARADAGWPAVALPPDASPFAVGEQIAVNGMPVRIQGFVSRTDMARLAGWFRRSLGPPLVEDLIGRKRILGRAQGEYYLSVQLEPLGLEQGTRGTVALSQLKTGYQRRDRTRAQTERLLARLPAGTRLSSQMTSIDGNKLASYVVLSNGHDEQLNRARVIELLREDGLVLEREGEAGVQARRMLPAAQANSRTLFFKGQGKEAMVVICRDEEGRSTIVLNTINVMEQ